MDALTEAIGRLLKRQDRSEGRLDRIEQALGIARPAPTPREAPYSQASAASATKPAPPPPPPPAVAARPIVAAERPRREATASIETRMGLTWINRIGALTLFLGAAFFFKYAVDNQWIGPWARVLLGIAIGLSLAASADRLWRGGHRVYAQGLCGAGAAILYLAFYAAFGFYQLLPREAAFGLMLATTIAIGILSLRYNALAIAALGLLGGYATPILLSTGQDQPWFFFSYLLLLNAAALGWAELREWRHLEPLAFGSTLILYAAWFHQHFLPEKRLVATSFALAYYALFAAAPSPWLLPASQLLAGLALVTLWAPPHVTYLPLALALSAAGLAIGEYRRRPKSPLMPFAGFWFFYASWHLAWSQSRPVGQVLLFLTGAFLLFLSRLPWQMWIGRVVNQGSLVLLAVNAAVYFTAGYSLLEPEYSDYRGRFAIALAAVHALLGLRLWSERGSEPRGAKPARLCFGIALCFLILAAPLQFSGYRITMAWALEAAALAWIGSSASESRLVRVALVIYALVLGRLFLIDSWMYLSAAAYEGLWNLRFLTFLVAVASFWAAAWWTRAGRAALAPYVAGHAALLWALVLEVVGWVSRNSAARNVASVSGMSVSILMALYGLALVAAGLFTWFAVNRILGLGLIGLVVLKLYLSDVWLLAHVYRIVAFSALGALLLTTSYLYSHHRARIESWWSSEQDHQ
jgi:uncharacterized membrane protein